VTRRCLPLALCLVLALTGPVGAALGKTQRALLAKYLSALRTARYADAFALLSADEKRYFGTVQNYESVFAADHFRIRTFKIVASKAAPPLGTVAVVVERIEFYDFARASPASADAKVLYGLVPGKSGLAIKDPYHPWRAYAPESVGGLTGGLHVTLRKVSFFAGRIETILTFANTGDQTVTLLPYGRSVVRDDAGRVLHPIETRLEALTDRRLRLGLRLAPSAQYTGAMTFATPDRFTPKTLGVTVAPLLADGADAPFSVALPSWDVPP
jgi:hypothetical protein